MRKLPQLPLTMSAAMLLAVCSHSASGPTVSPVVGTWQVTTVAYVGDAQPYYQQTYRFRRDGTGTWRLNMGAAPGHPAFHGAFPFMWSGAGGSVTVSLPSSGADRVNEKDFCAVSRDGRTLPVTKRQWQDKRQSGWQTAGAGLSLTKKL